ncbi:ABC transporter ATP-binding protein [Metasolibacillus meyeri]|uniref:ABC transporter ATP-binding protein n=1 Tax=Metasolibacillus meyeri TaxID=1071052 RepID=UPI000D31F8BD|nr:ABC transporter ATP-binding protein [Metasolibacillus meyeri]
MRRSRLAERYYTDRARISRKEDYETSYGETRLQPDILVYDDVPCRISQKALPSNMQTDTVNKISYETKLFIASQYNIKQGDKITVKRGLSTHLYTAGEPFFYADHQEISLQREDKA